MFYELGSALSSFATPALAIVGLVVLVRLLMHPLARAAVRGEKARAALAPEIEKLKKRYGKDQKKLQEKTMELYKEKGTSLFAGCLPMLVQAPFFWLMYRLVTTPNPLLDDTLFGVPLGAHWFGSFTHTPVFLVLFAALALVAFGTYRWTSAQAAKSGAPQPPFARLLRLLPFGTVLMAGILPLAAGIYLVTTSTWTLSERALLYRAVPHPPRAGAPARSRTT
ncbi:membrane protein insertase YidC [Actinosynnema sp. NPDC020468]|uniref:YidC/Oxa1 family membrane protein insertase n=1 Tax=Actinosynnema sp. NPDC020468 TaxID=3154488 RepID=UPI0033DBD76B